MKASASLAVGLPMLGARRLRVDPLEILNVAQVGVGGMGHSDLGSIASSRHARVVALCDVDAGALGQAAKEHPAAHTFRDYRRMLDGMARDIDAVVVSTPDHMHGPIALAALDLGKHVYCQKPIAHNLRECRAMARLAAERGVVTQMGTQIHSHAAYRTAVATLRSGVIGRVREAHLWVSRSWAGPAGGRPDHSDPVPDSLDWDLWIGVASPRPFVADAYHPARWRGWREFGSGTLGDMGCHIFDPVFSALALGAPIRAVSHGPAHGAETFAADGDIRYVFAGTEHTAGELPLRWTDGSGASRPDAARAQLPAGVDLPGDGSFLVGERGVMVIPHWSMPRFYKNGEELPVELTAMESRDHYHEWVDACRGEGTTSTPFSYAGPLTEAVLVGVIAGAFPGRELTFDPAALSFGAADVDPLVGRGYRAGFAVPGLR